MADIDIAYKMDSTYTKFGRLRVKVEEIRHSLHASRIVRQP